jgi:hypothetical protein
VEARTEVSGNCRDRPEHAPGPLRLKNSKEQEERKKENYDNGGTHRGVRQLLDPLERAARLLRDEEKKRKEHK